ncbi:MAG: tyrosine-type recombinase/integrase [Deltaproteobacteria bacterium]|nr:tyrosine-type recombinase/integrase [Deltaproteobacteria bacterium]
MKPFESFMAKQLEEYVAYRKGLGYAKKKIKPCLLAFDRYLQKQNINWDQLQPSFFLQLRAEISEHPNTVNEILLDIRSFFRFLVRKGVLEQNPLKDIPRLPKRYFVPFVFSQKQTQALIKTVCKNIRKKEKYFLLDMAIYVAIVMLARCGMRINEPLRLNRCHYRKREATVYIERTKFRKDRLIPLPKPVLAELESYLAARRNLCGNDQNQYLLAGRDHAPLRDQDIRFAFHRAVRQMGLYQPKQVIGNVTFGAPVPHSLRHSFAINTVNKIKARGQSPQHALPVLAAYMGHRKYQYTGAYLKVKDAKHRMGLLEFVKSRAVVK